MSDIVLQKPTDNELKEIKQAYKGGQPTPTPVKKDPDSPATTSLAWDKMKPRWDKIDAVLGGTETMRSAGEMYLPRHAEETLPRYRERLARSTLFNMTEITLDGWVGKPFSDPVIIPEDMPEEFEEMLEDIDLQGNNIDVFARHWFRSGLAKGFSHVLVEMPRLTPNENGQPRTLAQDKAENVRPYFVHIAPENILFAAAEMVNGKEMLTQVRILEEVTVMEGFMEHTIPQIRILYPGRGEIWRLKKTRGHKQIWVMAEEYLYDLSIIPLVTFYATREGFMLAKPPLTDLVDLNIAHWQSSSDQRNILTVARFPMLALSGSGSATGDETSQVTVSPYNYLFCPDPQGKYYYVEHSGAAIEAGRTDLQDLESLMAAYGSEFLKKKPGSQTATARALDSAEATSPLQDVTMRFKDALNQAMYLLGLWKGVEDLPDLEITTEFGPDTGDQNDLTALQAARTNRDISRLTLLNEFKRRKVLCEEFDPEEDHQELENEAMDITGAASLDLLNNPENPTNEPNTQ